MGDRRFYKRPTSFHHYNYGGELKADGDYSDGSYSDCDSCRRGVPPPQIICHRLRNKKTGQIADYYRYSAQKPCEDCCSKRNYNRSQERPRGGDGGGGCGCGPGGPGGSGCPGRPMMRFPKPEYGNPFTMGGGNKMVGRQGADMCSCRAGGGDVYEKQNKKSHPSYRGKH